MTKPLGATRDDNGHERLADDLDHVKNLRDSFLVLLGGDGLAREHEEHDDSHEVGVEVRVKDVPRQQLFANGQCGIDEGFLLRTPGAGVGAGADGETTAVQLERTPTHVPDSQVSPAAQAGLQSVATGSVMFMLPSHSYPGAHTPLMVLMSGAQIWLQKTASVAAVTVVIP